MMFGFCVIKGFLSQELIGFKDCFVNIRFISWHLEGRAVFCECDISR